MLFGYFLDLKKRYTGYQLDFCRLWHLLFLLTKVQSEFAGRAYAIYGGIYIVSSLAWLYFVEHQSPDKWDFAGAIVCLLGAFIILFMPR